MLSRNGVEGWLASIWAARYSDVSLNELLRKQRLRCPHMKVPLINRHRNTRLLLEFDLMKDMQCSLRLSSDAVLNQNTPWPVPNKSFPGHPKEVLITSSDNWRLAGGIKGERSSSWLKLFFNHAAFLRSLLGTTLAGNNITRPSETNAFNSYVCTQYEQQY